MEIVEERKIEVKFRRVGNAKAPEIEGNKIIIFANENSAISPKHRKCVKTGLDIVLPQGFIGVIKNDGGVALEKGLVVLEEFLDRREVEIKIINLSSEEVEIKKGMKIAEMVVKKVEMPELEECKSEDKSLTPEGEELKVIKEEIVKE